MLTSVFGLGPEQQRAAAPPQLGPLPRRTRFGRLLQFDSADIFASNWLTGTPLEPISSWQESASQWQDFEQTELFLLPHNGVSFYVMRLPYVKEQRRYFCAIQNRACILAWFYVGLCKLCSKQSTMATRLVSFRIVRVGCHTGT